MSEKLKRFVKFIESGGIITDVTLYNCLYEEMESALKLQELVEEKMIYAWGSEQHLLQSLLDDSQNTKKEKGDV